ncbi:aquaporin-like protein [Trichodelitschia bisporula]|uniref:Aquaporin-like protein n=1 Tax=Trichodelitschia bisporula TaxID=703511 RepID=A0A6G1I2J2_9PEZI|nr:aquaporin-like protein [Trichodelitschia bisporula]
MSDLHRLNTQDIELGTTQVLQRHLTRHVGTARPISQRRLDFEFARPRLLREMAAEATGVFFYVYPGIAATAAFTVEKGNPAFGSSLTIGLAYCFGIALAIITCASTSGGHFNPAITLCFATWQGFPWRKAPFYIMAQIFGAFAAGLVLMAQYHEQMASLSHDLAGSGIDGAIATGPASVFITYWQPSGNGPGWVFLVEFFVASFIGLVIWAVLDPANPFVTPSAAPFIIGIAYACMVWGFSSFSISTNLARDLGCRLVAAMFYGRNAFSYKNYWWIGMFVNIPATFFATGYYELVLRDSLDRIGLGHAQHEDGDEGLVTHFAKHGLIRDVDIDMRYVRSKS